MVVAVVKRSAVTKKIGRCGEVAVSGGSTVHSNGLCIVFSGKYNS